jgi:hypothetical protein
MSSFLKSIPHQFLNPMSISHAKQGFTILIHRTRAREEKSESLIGAITKCIAGSADLYQATEQMPINSIYFIMCLDGFTLFDMVSYDREHNEANGEDNWDGPYHNLSWNCGIEGEANDAPIEALRERQIKNFVVLLMLSHLLTEECVFKREEAEYSKSLFENVVAKRQHTSAHIEIALTLLIRASAGKHDRRCHDVRVYCLQ